MRFAAANFKTLPHDMVRHAILLIVASINAILSAGGTGEGKGEISRRSHSEEPSAFLFKPDLFRARTFARYFQGYCIFLILSG